MSGGRRPGGERRGAHPHSQPGRPRTPTRFPARFPARSSARHRGRRLLQPAGRCGWVLCFPRAVPSTVKVSGARGGIALHCIQRCLAWHETSRETLHCIACDVSLHCMGRGGVVLPRGTAGRQGHGRAGLPGEGRTFPPPVHPLCWAPGRDTASPWAQSSWRPGLPGPPPALGWAAQGLPAKRRARSQPLPGLCALVPSLPPAGGASPAAAAPVPVKPLRAGRSSSLDYNAEVLDYSAGPVFPFVALLPEAGGGFSPQCRRGGVGTDTVKTTPR